MVRSVLESTTPPKRKSCCLFACLFLCVFPVNICYTLPCHYLRGLVQSNVSHSLEWPLHRKWTRFYYVIYILLLNWYEPHICILKADLKASTKTDTAMSEHNFGRSVPYFFSLMIYDEIIINFMNSSYSRVRDKRTPTFIDFWILYQGLLSYYGFKRLKFYYISLDILGGSIYSFCQISRASVYSRGYVYSGL